VGVVAIGLPEKDPLARFKEPRVPLHADYVRRIGPAIESSALVRGVIRIVPPELLYRAITVTMHKPSQRPKDQIDSGLPGDPYTVTAVKPGSVWAVRYDGPQVTDPFALSMMGLTPDEWCQASIAAARGASDGNTDAAWRDAQVTTAYMKTSHEQWLEGQTGQKFPLTSAVVKLPTGGVLLYTPTVVHPDTEAGRWLDLLVDAMGPVKYIVIGSAFHTLHLPEVIKRYPDAAVIGTPMAADKLAAVGALPRGALDHSATTASDLDVVNRALAADNVELFVIEGDCAVQSITAVAHGTALEVDILYGHHAACPCDTCSDDNLREDPALAMMRTFWRVFIDAPNSPTGMLPHYRYEMMDPTGAFALFAGPHGAAPNGSSCRRMAASLRRFLAADFNMAISTHALHPIPATDFRRSIDLAWRWLDGSSLVPP